MLYAALLDGGAPDGDRWPSEGYLPALILCATPPGSTCHVLWPRYWVKPGAHVRFGQDGPQLTVAEWDYLTEKVRRFAAGRGIEL